MGRTRALALAAAMAAVVASSCGGDDQQTLDRRAFRSAANAQCRKLQQAGDELRAASDPAVTGEAVTRRLEAAAGILRARVRAIDDLVPPPAATDSTALLVSTLARYANQLVALGERAAPGESFAALQSEHPRLVQRLNQLTNQANVLAASLRLDECISGTVAR
jgi:hypothetical protein